MCVFMSFWPAILLGFGEPNSTDQPFRFWGGKRGNGGKRCTCATRETPSAPPPPPKRWLWFTLCCVACTEHIRASNLGVLSGQAVTKRCVLQSFRFFFSAALVVCCSRSTRRKSDQMESTDRLAAIGPGTGRTTHRARDPRRPARIGGHGVCLGMQFEY